MKKGLIIVLLSLMMAVAVIGNVLATTLPGYENYKTQYKIADYTLQFKDHLGTEGTGTFTILNDPDYTNDEVIEITLKGCWTMNETHIRQITHVNGIPIQQTKWAKYGGIIQHVGGNYVFPDDPPQKPIEQLKEITVFVRKDQVKFPDQKPVIIMGRTMVPVRAVFEHKYVQAKVTWDAENRTVTAKDRSGKTVIFRIGENNYRVIYRGKEEYQYSDVAPVIQNGRTLLPLRALSESLNFQVDWLDQERKVELKEKTGYYRELMSEAQWEKHLKNGGQP
jgi:hypothetical protein